MHIYIYICSTRIAEEEMKKNKVADWVEEIHSRKYRYAGKIARQNDGRWTREVLTWSAGGKRPRRRPLTRWTDSLEKFVKQTYRHNTAEQNTWTQVAMDEESWSSLEPTYLNCVLGR